MFWWYFIILFIFKSGLESRLVVCKNKSLCFYVICNNTMQIEKVDGIFSKRLFLIKKMELGKHIPKQIIKMLNLLIRIWWGLKNFVYTAWCNWYQNFKTNLDLVSESLKLLPFFNLQQLVLSVLGACLSVFFMNCFQFLILTFILLLLFQFLSCRMMLQ